MRNPDMENSQIMEIGGQTEAQTSDHSESVQTAGDSGVDFHSPQTSDSGA